MKHNIKTAQNARFYAIQHNFAAKLCITFVNSKFSEKLANFYDI